MAIVEDLCRRGDRHYGAPGRSEVIAHLRSALDSVADQTALQRLEAVERRSGKRFELVNIIGRLNPGAKRRVLLGSHWDTRLWAEEDDDEARQDEPIEGANDGTSGVAVLLELGRVVKESRALDRVGLDLVLFDGEEFGRPGSNDYCQGSRHFASRLGALYPHGRPAWAIVIDMVGDCEQGFLPEKTSLRAAPDLVGRVWTAARDLGYEDRFRSDGTWSIVDDHTALQRARVPAMLLIDYDYPFWHTHEDTVDKVCEESLARVGKVLLKVLLEEEAHDG
jgi:hypothetical protein